MEVQLPEGYTLIEIEGKPIEFKNHVLVVRDEDEQQIWMPLPLENNEEKEHDVTEVEPAVPTRVLESSEKRKDWNKEDTYLFISLLEKYKTELGDPKHKKKSIFENISKEMAEISKGQHTPSPVQCENRYKSLVKKFREIKDQNNGSGAARKDWLFYNKMADFFGDRPNVTPAAGCSSIELAKEENLRQTLKEKLKRPLECTDNSDKPAKVVKKTKVRSEVLKVLESIESKVDEREERKMKMVQQQHEDLKALMTRMLDVMEKKN